MIVRGNAQSDHRTLDDGARAELRARAPEIVQSFLGKPNRRLSNARQLRWGLERHGRAHISLCRLWESRQTALALALRRPGAFS